eukprot:TRINITY_DN122260_c0_g1_i1.p1 TRINITY_DN122260_c0_g1~~TRINITY_DN122260_c0_g1_i1.p1  ORF type:complete len:486 (+),score=85.86 TRINITY_DN122260_c0_g1_i1:29-1486(+)
MVRQAHSAAFCPTMVAALSSFRARVDRFLDGRRWWCGRRRSASEDAGDSHSYLIAGSRGGCGYGQQPRRRSVSECYVEREVDVKAWCSASLCRGAGDAGSELAREQEAPADAAGARQRGSEGGMKGSFSISVEPPKDAGPSARSSSTSPTMSPTSPARPRNPEKSPDNSLSSESTAPSLEVTSRGSSKGSSRSSTPSAEEVAAQTLVAWQTAVPSEDEEDDLLDSDGKSDPDEDEADEWAAASLTLRDVLRQCSSSLSPKNKDRSKAMPTVLPAVDADLERGSGGSPAARFQAEDPAAAAAGKPVQVPADEEGSAAEESSCGERPPPVVGDIVVLSATLPDHRGEPAVVTKVHCDHCTVVALDPERRYGIGECWPSFRDMSPAVLPLRLGAKVQITDLKGAKAPILNGQTGRIVAHPKEGHPTFIQKPSMPGKPILVVTVKFDDRKAAGQASLMLEPRFLEVIGLSEQPKQHGSDTSVVKFDSPE